MSLAHWPQDLPPFLRAAYTRTSTEGRRKGASDTFPTYGRRTSRVADQMTLGIEATVSQHRTFWAFYRETLKLGALPFFLPDPVYDGLPLLLEDGVTHLSVDAKALRISATLIAQFADELPQEQVSGGVYVITFALWVLG